MIKNLLATAVIALPMAAFAATPTAGATATEARSNVVANNAPAQVHTVRKAAKAVCDKQVAGQKLKSHAQAKGASSNCETK